MIVIPEKVAFIKVPKAASTTIARLFWDNYKVEQFSHLKPDVAAQIRYFMTLDKVGPQIPVLNGNWFYNRSGAFGWHTAYAELQHLFGEQLADFHWVASVRHPVARMFSAFSFQIAKKRIEASLCSEDFERFCDRVFSGGAGLTHQQRIPPGHRATGSQTRMKTWISRSFGRSVLGRTSRASHTEFRALRLQTLVM